MHNVYVFDDADVCASTRTTRIRSYDVDDATIAHTFDDIDAYARSLDVTLTRRMSHTNDAQRRSIVLQYVREHVDDDAARIARAHRDARRDANTQLWNDMYARSQSNDDVFDNM
jgi:hypothetical protein